MNRVGSIVAVGADNQADFLAYCQQHGREHDESYLPDGDFELSQDYPAFLLCDDQHTIGAACLIRTPNFVQARKGRWLILHTLLPDPAGYMLLLDAMLQHAAGLDFLYGFIPEELQATRSAWEQIGLSVQRCSYVLSWQASTPPQVALPPGFDFRSVDPADLDQVAAARDVLNASFAGQAGHVGNTVDTLLKTLSGPLQLPGGMLLLYDQDRPVGSVHITRDDNESSTGFIDMLGVIPACQGRGLGRLLIRKAIDFAVAQGFPKLSLSVNAENEAAVKLYFSEGFEKDIVMVCYQHLINS